VGRWQGLHGGTYLRPPVTWGAAGKLPSTHDVGMRNAWALNSPVSQRQYLVLLEDGGKLEIPAGAPVPKRG
jgi:hydroxylamine dehydrogenase